MSSFTDAHVALGVQNTLAAYAHALDDGRTDDIVQLFTLDGTAEIVGIGTAEGRDAIRTLYSGMVPTAPQCHMVANTVITSATADEARAVSDFVLVLRGESGWAIQVSGCYEDLLGRSEDGWRFRSRKTTFLM